MKHFLKARWAFVFLLTVLGWSLCSLTAFAVDAHNYTLIYPSDDGAKRKIRDEIKSSGIGSGNGGLESTSILTKGGRLGNAQFKFNRSQSDDKDMPIYSAMVYCTLKDSKITMQKPADNELYVQYEMGVGIYTGGTGGALFSKSEYQTWVGPIDGGDHWLHLPSYTPPVDSEDDGLSGSNHDVAFKDNNNRGKKPNGNNTSAVHSRIDIKSNFDIDNGQTLAIYKAWPELFEDWDQDKADTMTKYPDSDDYEYDDSMREDLQEYVNKCLPVPSSGNLTSNYEKLSDEDKAGWDDVKATAASTDVSGDDSAETGTNCQGGAMGWLFCPMIQAMASTVQLAAGLIDQLMQVRFLAQEGPSKQIEVAWRAFLSLANIALVIAFMFIIFSQATSAGLSNYGIKRMLPRLIIAAILMNLSFYICAFAIDISNILGSSIMGFLVGSGNSVASSVTAATGGSGAGSILGWLAAGAAIIALAFFLFVPVVLSIIVVLVTLIGRQVILMCLVLVSPLAFVAWLLPNTEKWFKKWYEVFFQMLVLYPMIMLMFGASLYLSNLLGDPSVGTNIIEIGG